MVSGVDIFVDIVERGDAARFEATEGDKIREVMDQAKACFFYVIKEATPHARRLRKMTQDDKSPGGSGTLRGFLCYLPSCSAACSMGRNVYGLLPVRTCKRSK